MENRILLKLLRENHLKCTGCGACAEICTRQVLLMERNREGFYYPEIKNESMCVQCGKCLAVCPIEKFEGNSSRKQF